MHDDEEAIKCARSQREKRRNKKVVPSWIFFACGGPKTPIHLRRHSRVRKIAGGKTDGSTPIHREMMTCASEKRRNKKVVPSWIFFACGGPKTPIHLRRHSRVRKIAGGKTDGSTPIHREMMTCASRFPKLKKRAFCLPFLEV